jgi:4-amino-4-deoxy-L-arabinose transferase-like glycosyltransferase
VVALITVVAAALRLYHIDQVPVDPFYDSAVRSMALSWHNFFFGAMEPGGSVSIDKPPVDLWLQVASVKLVGFNTTALMLPEALAGTAAVPLLFVAVRRIWSISAGIAAALALAVLPIEVITARSDTMDGVMMALLVLALLLIVRACETGRIAWLLLGATALGMAFDVKLLESLLALPGLALIAYLGLPGSRKRRLSQVLAAGAVYVVVALSWLTATLLFPAHDRPFAVGSSNGSAWNAAFVFNGLERLEGKPQPGQSIQGAHGPGSVPTSRYPQLNQTERDHIPLPLPSAARLLDRVGPLSGERLGLEALVGLLLGLAALASEWRERRRRSRAGPGGREAREVPGPTTADVTEANPAETARRLRWAGLMGLLLWLAMGIVLFSQMAHLHPRYTEGFTPAVAATLGIGVAWATAERSAWRLAALGGTLLVVVIYTERLLFGALPIWWVVLLGALAAIVLGGLALAHGDGEGDGDGEGEGDGDSGGGGSLAPAMTHRLLAGALVLTLVSVLAIPAWASVRAVKQNVSDTNRLGLMSPRELSTLSAYLRAHQGSARYETAYDAATTMGSLVVRDARPILVLTTLNARVLTPVARLRALAAAGEVRYAILTSRCGPHTPRTEADCSAPALWVRAHARDISRQVGLRPGLLWLLPGPATQALARGGGRGAG